MTDLQALYGNAQKILLVGTYPPPLGGISVFIYRLQKLLESKNIEASVFDTSRSNGLWGSRFIGFIITLIRGEYNIIHIQHFDFKKVIVLLLFRPFKSYRIYFTDHNPFQFDQKGYFSLWMFKLLLPHIDCLMTVNSHIIENYKTHAVKMPPKILVCNAFIPPPIEEKERIIATYPPEILAFMNLKTPLLIANAFQIRMINGIDLYGIDMCIELAGKLKPLFPNLGFIFCLANEKANIARMELYQLQIREQHLNDVFFFLTGQKEIWPLYEKTHLFIRPTFRDGYGISIDEALYFKCPAIASDACVRNRQAVIFKNRDIEDLFNKSLFLLKKYNHG